jgi:putative cardiolipin synthase
VAQRKLLAGGVLAGALTAALFLVWSQPMVRPGLPIESALGSADQTPLDHLTAPLEAQHPGQSAFRLVTEGSEAFIGRMRATRMAMRSIDVQMYIWHADLTGRYLSQELLLAADRGVKVRVLLDDVDARKHNDVVAALDAHPNAEIRIFNPFESRHGKFGLVREGIARFGRINRRMHNKSWIVDNRIAFVGGRNVGDEYFGASDEVNFVDLDFAMIGPVVRDASDSFDRYWNSPFAYPIEMLAPDLVTEAALARHRQALSTHAQAAESSRYARELRESPELQQMLEGRWPMRWTTNYQFVADDPEKITMKGRDVPRTRVGLLLTPMVRQAQARVYIISPYFVPGDKVTSWLVDAARSGKAVHVLTNSLVANDVAAVHGGYSRYRPVLLEGGVRIWELKPTNGGKADASLFGSSGASLHTKAFSVDGHVAFIGSFNLDQRSTWLNCEQGVMVSDDALAAQLESLFTKHADPLFAWSVFLEDGDLRWTDGRRTYDSEPLAPRSRRFAAWMTRVLHMDAQL